MYNYSKLSKERLETCHTDLQLIFNKVIKIYDISILCGYRTPREQSELYKHGREYKEGEWFLKNNTKIVTHADGYNFKSPHNLKPALAIDCVPYPIDWNNINRFFHMAGIIQGIAFELKIDIKWGGNFKNIKDYSHFELKRK